MNGLIESIASVHYTSDKYLIVVVDDGSKEPITEEILNTGLLKKNPLHIIRIPENTGITVALNTGLKWIEKHCDTSYIARLDAGDICDPQRFYIQVGEMRKDDSALLCGTWCKFLSRKKDFSYLYKTPLEANEIRKAMYSRNVFIHPAVMFKKNVVTSLGLYPDAFPFAEDYAYFWKIINEGNCFIIPKILTICEMNEMGISLTHRKAQLLSRQMVIKKFGVNPYRRACGVIKIRLLLIIPNTVILWLKQLAR